MAITASVIAAMSLDTTATQAAFVSASVAAPSGKTVLAFVTSRKGTAADTPTLAGTNGWNVTWTQVASLATGGSTLARLTVFRGIPSSTTAGRLTVTHATSHLQCQLVTLELSGVDQATNQGVVGTADTNSGSTGGALDITFSPTITANNLAIMAGVARASPTSFTPDTTPVPDGSTSLVGFGVCGFGLQWVVSAISSFQGTLVAGSTWATVGVEIKATTGIAATADQAAEVDTAQAVAHRRTLPVGQGATVETAQAVTRRRTYALGQPAERDVAQTVTIRRTRLLVQAMEQDTPQPVTARKTRALLQPSEVDTARGVILLRTVAVARASEGDTAQAATVRLSHLVAVGRAQEVDAAQAVTIRRTRTLGQAAEVDHPQLPTPVLADDFNRANEIPLSGPWAAAGPNPLVLLSNHVQAWESAHAIPPGLSVAYWSAGASLLDQSSQCAITEDGGSPYPVAGPCVRVAPTTLSLSCYHAAVAHVGVGVATLTLHKYVSNTRTTLATFTGLTVSYGDVITLTAAGSTLRAYLNGTPIGGPVTDTSLSAGAPGVGIQYLDTGTPNLDDFFGGALADATWNVTPRKTYHVAQATEVDHPQLETVFDDFTRANEGVLQPPWDLLGPNSFNLNDTHVNPSGGSPVTPPGVAAAHYGGAPSPANAFAQCEIYSTATTTTFGGPAVRMGRFLAGFPTSGSEYFTGYTAEGSILEPRSTSQIRIRKYLNNLVTTLATITTTVDFHDLLMLTVSSADVLRVYVNGALVGSVTDHDIPSGSVGLVGRDWDLYLDTWSGGALPDATWTVTARKTYHLGQPAEEDLAQAVAVTGPTTQVVSVGQASEVDAAHAPTSRKTRTVLQATEQDTATVVTGRKTRLLGLAPEQDLAASITGRKTAAVGRAGEVDAARPLTVGKARGVLQTGEADTAQAVGARKIAPVGRAAEQDTATAATSRKQRLLGLAPEADLAAMVSGRKTQALGQAPEVDTARTLVVGKARTVTQVGEREAAQVVGSRKTRPLVQVGEQDTATATTSHKRAVLVQASEVDTARGHTARKTASIGQAGEADTARATVPKLIALVGRAAEVDSARSVSATTNLVVSVDPATEVDAAQGLTRRKTSPILQAGERDAAQATTRLQTRILGQPGERDTTLAASSRKTATVGRAFETDTAQAPTVRRTLGVGRATEQDGALAATARKIRALVQAGEVDAAQPVSATLDKTVLVDMAAEVDTARAVAWAPQKRLAGQASEQDAAQAVAAGKRLALGLAREGEAALACSSLKRVTLGQAPEADLAQDVGVLGEQTLLVGLASEVDTAHSVTGRRIYALVQAREVDAATGAARLRLVSVLRAGETDLARALLSRKLQQIGQAFETDTAVPLGAGPQGLGDVLVGTVVSLLPTYTVGLLAPGVHTATSLVPVRLAEGRVASYAATSRFPILLAEAA